MNASIGISCTRKLLVSSGFMDLKLPMSRFSYAQIQYPCAQGEVLADKNPSADKRTSLQL